MPYDTNFIQFFVHLFLGGGEEVKRLKVLCNEYEIEGREILDTFTNTELASVFNGIGPVSFQDWHG